MTWFWLTILYVVFQVVAELINKKTISHEDIDEVVFGASIQLAAGVMCLVLALIIGWKFEFTSSS
ncbi:MAG: hypothetical protein Q7S76_02765, partial [bacterium]|nr:hypothetical protein [bacterium]